MLCTQKQRLDDSEQWNPAALLTSTLTSDKSQHVTFQDSHCQPTSQHTGHSQLTSGHLGSSQTDRLASSTAAVEPAAIRSAFAVGVRTLDF